MRVSKNIASGRNFSRCSLDTERTAHGGEMSVHHRPHALHRPTTCSLTSSSLCEQVSFATTAPKLCSDGLDLLTQMLRYEPGHRISAKAAMSHPYFKELDQTRFKAA